MEHHEWNTVNTDPATRSPATRWPSARCWRVAGVRR